MSSFSKMEELDLSHGGLTELPAIPNRTRVLYCENNRLTSLPPLPESLRMLNCSNNPLTSLPELHEGLISIECENTRLKTLPELPESLIEIYLQGNDLEEPYKEFVQDYMMFIDDTNSPDDMLDAISYLRSRVNQYIRSVRLGNMLKKKAKGLAVRNVFTAKTGMTATRGPASTIQRFLGVAPPKRSEIYNDESWARKGGRTRSKKRSKKRSKRKSRR
jgi:hypothetical protein